MAEEKIIIDGVERLIASQSQWQQRRDELLIKEKAHTRAGDRLAAERRRLPWTRVRPGYRFESLAGGHDLVDLFAGRRQLIVYHHMLMDDDPAPCPGCAMVGDQIPHLSHLHQRDTSLVFVSAAAVNEIDAFKQRMGWHMPWYASRDSFNADFGIDGGFGVNVFYRDGENIYRSYFTTGRAAEMLGTVWAFLDLTPGGRQEDWEDSPPNSIQTPPYQWWRLHDEYDAVK